MRIYGPYTAKDGRQRMVVKLDSGKKTTISYPKYLMQQRLGRKLHPDEVVHHKNENPLDNTAGNLEVKQRRVHSSEHHVQMEMVTFDCPECGAEVTKQANKIRHNRKQGKAGPFCSKRCAGLWSRQKQLSP